MRLLSLLGTLVHSESLVQLIKQNNGRNSGLFNQVQ